MLDPNTLTDEVVAMVRTNTLLIPLLTTLPDANLKFPTPQSRIFSYDTADPTGSNFEQAIQEQPRGTVMIHWLRTQADTFARLEATKHDFVAYIKIVGKAGQWMRAFTDGTVTTYDASTNRFRWAQPDIAVNPPDKVEGGPQPFIIAQNFMLYDMVAIRFTYTERGVDVV